VKRPTHVLTLRDTLRLLALATLATTCATLTGCGEEGASSSAGTKLVAADVDRSSGSPDDVDAVVTAVHGLAGGLYGRLAKADGNLALSPYSVAVALAMTRNGAAGGTAEEMSTVLGLEAVGLDLDAFNGGINALTQAVGGLAGTFDRPDDDPAEIALDSANALFGDQSVTWNEEFLGELARSYGAGMQAVDYVADAEAARTAINGWTAERTHNRIPEIVPEGAIGDLTRLVLVNALYFKAPWAKELEESATSPRPFEVPGQDSVQVDTMAGIVEPASYGAGDGWQAARLPYFGGTLAMTVVLPDAGAMAAVEEAVSGGGLRDILMAPEPQAVQLLLPKWTFSSGSALKQVLTELGMPTAFDPDSADFSAMTADGGTDLHVDDVVHQTFIAVDEHGTEAAAATAVLMGTTSMPETVDFVVDRPFLFVIHDTAHLTPLFLGRVTDPRG
jgi:serpin B